MKATGIKSVTTDVIGQSIKCSVNMAVPGLDNLMFAFYIVRNGIKIHKTRYSSNSAFTFDAKGTPGYYRVIGFVKAPDGTIESAKSAPVFFRPLELNSQNLDEFDPDLRAYELKGDVWNFPALYFPGDTNTLYIMMPSAFDRTKSTLPVFNRWTWADQGIFPGHVLCIADPTLELQNELQLGWLLGHKSSNLIEDLAKFILKFAKNLSIPNHKIVVYGSSAGGFAALALAACIKNSTAVAINAQTDVLSFASRKQVNLIRGACFDDMPENEIRLEFGDRVDMSTRWKNYDAGRIILVQNELDTHHFDIHFKPFVTALGGHLCNGLSSFGNHTSWVYRDEAGHIPETILMAKKIVEMIG